MIDMKKRVLALLMTCTIFAAAESAPAQSEEKITDPRLVKTATEYGLNYETGEWYKMNVYEYTYENAYPVEIKTTNSDGEVMPLNTFEYTFKDDVPMTRKDYLDKELIKIVEYDQGRHYHEKKIYMDGSKEIDVGNNYYAYSNQDEYMTQFLTETFEYNDEDGIVATMEEVDSVLVTTQNGLLEKTVNTGMYANWGIDEKKEWMRFNGTYTINYDKNGIAADTSAIYRKGESGPQYRVEKTIENGLITEIVVQNCINDKEEWAPEKKIIFEYTDTSISESRYAWMMNAFAMEYNAGYIYNWY